MYSIQNLLVLIALIAPSKTSVRLTNIKCLNLHPDFAIFEKCRLKIVKRDTVALNIHVNLLQTPVNNVSVNLALLKKANGYHPFLYNVTMDFCKFQKNRNRQPFAKLFFDFLLKDSTNLNHTCPYNHDVIINNLILVEDMFKYLPLPEGEYMFQMKWGAYNDWKADVKAYMSVHLSFAD